MHTSHLDQAAPERCICDGQSACVCTPGERTLRAYCDPNTTFRFEAPMTSEMRQECLDQIGMVEGFKREEYVDAPDALLANGVLHAWEEYCRDKGVL